MWVITSYDELFEIETIHGLARSEQDAKRICKDFNSQNPNLDEWVYTEYNIFS